MAGTDRASKAPTTHNQSIQAATMTETMEEGTSQAPHTDSDVNVTEPRKSPQSRSSTPPNRAPATPPRNHKPRQISSRATSSTRTTPSRSSSRHPISTNTPCSSRPTSSHYTNTSRRSSVSTSTRQHPTRHSSFPTNAYRPLPHRDPWGSYIHLHENPFLPRHSSKSSAAVEHGITTFETFPSKASLRSPSLPVFPTSFPPSDDVVVEDETGEETRPTTNQPTYSNFFPATTIDWKLPSTRKREYEAIERRGRGVRGLWRRVMPRWCRRRDSELGFWDAGKERGDGKGKRGGKSGGDGGGSVRRYRVDVDFEGVGEEQIEGKRKGAWWRRKNAVGGVD